MHLESFERNESAVRYYCRILPNLLASASGAVIRDSEGKRFIDFLSACGALNYGHNHPALKSAAIDYIASDGIVAGLDFHTEAKLAFIERFRARILAPRGMNYKLQFPGPTGTNCVEAALKLARKVTGRTSIAAFTNAFHGMSSGSLAVTGSRSARQASAPLLNGVVRLPFDGYLGSGVADLERFEAMASDPSGGVDPVAAFLVECVQGEGGLNVASAEWLRHLAAVAKRLGALLIVDDIQAGCGRTGSFFSFEAAGVAPDMICIAKSISGYGLPMSLMLLKPEIDVWNPGEHNGTFRGNSLAFVTASAAIGLWDNGEMACLQGHCRTLSEWVARMAAEFGGWLRPKGIGMMQGLSFARSEHAQAAAAAALRRGVVIECCGPYDEVLKIVPPLNIDSAVLHEGLQLLEEAVREALTSHAPASARVAN